MFDQETDAEFRLTLTCQWQYEIISPFIMRSRRTSSSHDENYLRFGKRSHQRVYDVRLRFRFLFPAECENWPSLRSSAIHGIPELTATVCLLLHTREPMINYVTPRTQKFTFPLIHFNNVLNIGWIVDDWTLVTCVFHETKRNGNDFNVYIVLYS